MYEHAKLKEFELRVELTWDARQSTSLEGKVLREQVFCGPEMIFLQVDKDQTKNIQSSKLSN